MKKPESFEEFKKLLFNMTHRERFVFDAGNKFLEVYCTIKYSSPNIPTNYNFQYWNDQDSKPVNRQKEYLSESTLKCLYDGLS